jgi:signal transduction histidine kinase
MSWCAVFLFPAFVLLDYLVLEDWEVFFIVRLCAMVAIVLMLSLKDRFNLSNDFIAHFSCHVVFVTLMWMLSLLKTADHFFIYSFNTSVGYITSAIFLIWRPRHSIIILTSTLASFGVFCCLFSTLPVKDIISHGFLVLIAVMIISQLYVLFRYKVMFRDFVRQMELNHAYEELKNKNAEINQRNFEVLLQKEKLEELNELKDRIFMIISRDFRTPLHSLKGLIFLLNGSDLISPEEFRMVLRGLKNNVDQAHDLLENVQLWSRSQVKDFSIEDQKVSIHDLVVECCDLLTGSASEKGVTILNFVDEHVFVKADREMVRLVLRNLISNAIKITENAGRIIVRSSRENRSVNVSVVDTSTGMELNQQTEVFAHALGKKGVYEDNGKGLGLMICKELIEKNNGRIWIESEPGKGNTFIFSLPAVEEQIAVALNASPKSSR